MVLHSKMSHTERDGFSACTGASAKTFLHPVIQAQKEKDVPLALHAGRLLGQNLLHLAEVEVRCESGISVKQDIAQCSDRFEPACYRREEAFLFAIYDGGRQHALRKLLMQCFSAE